MGTLIHRRMAFCAAALLTVGLAACGSDATGPTTETGTAPNGTTITVDSVVNNQTAIAGDTIAVFVRVKTASGAPIVGDTVTWNVATGGGSVPSTKTVTDANGIASIAWALGVMAGPNSLGANITGAAVPILATGSVGPLALLTQISPDSQLVAATGSVFLTARATDINGNPVDSVNVAWSATAGLITPAIAASGTSGNSSVNFTTPIGVSRYLVTAIAPGLPAVTFIVKTF